MHLAFYGLALPLDYEKESDLPSLSADFGCIGLLSLYQKSKERGLFQQGFCYSGYQFHHEDIPRR